MSSATNPIVAVPISIGATLPETFPANHWFSELLARLTQHSELPLLGSDSDPATDSHTPTPHFEARTRLRDEKEEVGNTATSDNTSDVDIRTASLLAYLVPPSLVPKIPGQCAPFDPRVGPDALATDSQARSQSQQPQADGEVERWHSAAEQLMLRTVGTASRVPNGPVEGTDPNPSTTAEALRIHAPEAIDIKAQPADNHDPDVASPTSRAHAESDCHNAGPLDVQPDLHIIEVPFSGIARSGPLSAPVEVKLSSTKPDLLTIGATTTRGQRRTLRDDELSSDRIALKQESSPAQTGLDSSPVRADIPNSTLHEVHPMIPHTMLHFTDSHPGANGESLPNKTLAGPEPTPEPTHRAEVGDVRRAVLTTQATNEIRVHVRTAQAGTVEVRTTLEHGQVDARIVSTGSDVPNISTAEVSELRDRLAANDMSLRELTFQSSGMSTGQESRGHDRHFVPEPPQESRALEESRPPSQPHPVAVPVIQHQGALNVRA